MLNLNFFNQVAGNFRDHYYDLIRRLDDASQSSTQKVPQAEPTVEQQPQPADQYIPSPEAQAAAEQAPAAPPVDSNPVVSRPNPDQMLPENSEPATQPENDNDSDDTAAVQKHPDGTYYMKSQVRLDYSMTLRFDLATFTRTIEKAAEGDTRSVEQLAAAGFGLNANMAFDGSSKTMIRTAGTDAPEHPSQQIQRAGARAGSAGALAYGDKNFALNAFYKEASSIRRGSLVINNHGHQMAVKKFALRFSLDSRFEMANLSRFNLQTKQMADQKPDSVNSYIDSAGNLAASGSTEMMTAFFDAVENYLSGAHDKLVSSATAAFDQAVAELGFEGDMVDQARAKFVGTIDNFFGRVDAAVSNLRDQYLPEAPPADPITSQPVEIATEPKQQPDPAQVTTGDSLAVA